MVSFGVHGRLQLHRFNDYDCISIIGIHQTPIWCTTKTTLLYVAIDCLSQAASGTQGKARKAAQQSGAAVRQVATASWACQAVQPQHAEAELLEEQQDFGSVPAYSTVADLETILQERDACGVSCEATYWFVAFVQAIWRVQMVALGRVVDRRVL